MEYFGWILAAFSIGVLALVYLYSTGWFKRFKRNLKIPKPPLKRREAPVLDASSELDNTPQPEVPVAKPPPIKPDSKVVTVRIVPQPDTQFPAEQLVLALRAAGFKHGEFDIFHNHDPLGEGRIRYSVASLVEPGGFDLSKLKESEYPGISIFMVLPVPEDGLALFDEMMACAHRLAKELDGRLIDEQGSLFSVQRERYMREEVIEFLRQQLKVGEQEDLFAIGNE